MKEPRYGYAPLPSEQQLDERQRMKQMSIIAAARQKSLAGDREQAQELAQTPVDGGSWAGLIGSAMQGEVGRTRDARGQRQEQENQVRLNQALGAQAKAAQEDAMRQEAFELNKARLAQKNKLEDQRIKEAQHRENLAFKKAKAAAEGKVKKHTKAGIHFREDGTEFKGSFNEQTGMWDVVGSDEKIPDGQVVIHGDKKLPDKSSEAWARAPENIKRIRAYGAKADDEWEKIFQPTGLPTEMINKYIFGDLEKSALLEHVNGTGLFGKKFSAEERAAIRQQIAFMDDFKLNVYMPYRELVTSGVLSDQDVNEFNNAMSVFSGVSPEVGKQAIYNLMGSMEGNLRTTNEMWREAGDKSAYRAARVAYRDIEGTDPVYVMGEDGNYRSTQQRESKPPPVTPPAEQPQEKKPPPTPQQEYISKRKLLERPDVPDAVKAKIAKELEEEDRRIRAEEIPGV